jgi:uncharacterized membrane protein
MEAFFIGLAVLLVLAGPVALIWVIVLQMRLGVLETEIRRGKARSEKRTVYAPAKPPPLPPGVVKESDAEPREGVQKIETPGSSSERDVVYDEKIRPVEAEPPEETRAETVPVPSKASLPAKKRIPRTTSFERFIGMKALNWAGVITSLFAVAYTLKVSYEKGWLGGWGISLLVYAAGLVLLVLGHLFRRKGLGYAAEGVSALGYGVLYAASYCACQVFDLIPNETAFAVMAVTTVLGATMSVFYRSQILAGLIFLGGYLTPVLLSTGEDHGGFLTGYLALLGSGATALHLTFHWRFVKLLSPAATYLIFFGWYQQFGHDRIGVAITGSVLFFLLFSLSPLLPGLLGRAKQRAEDAGLSLANALVCLAYLYDLLYEDHRLALFFALLGLRLYFCAQYFMVKRADRGDAPLAVVGLLLSMGLFTAAIPVKFGPWTTAVTWAVEGALLLALGLSPLNRWLLLGSVASHALCVSKLLKYFPLHETTFSPFFNAPCLAWILVALAFLASAALWRRKRNGGERVFVGSDVNELLYLLYATLTGATLAMLGASEIIAHSTLNLDLEWLDAMTHVWLLGAVITLAYVLLSRIFHEEILAGIGLLFLAATLVAFALTLLPSYEDEFSLVLNSTFLSGLAVTAAGTCAAWLMKGRGFQFLGYAAAGGIAAYLLGQAEVLVHFDHNLGLSWKEGTPYFWLAGLVVALAYVVIAWRSKIFSLACLGAWAHGAVLSSFLCTFTLYHRAPFTPMLNPYFLGGFALAFSLGLSGRLSTPLLSPRMKALHGAAMVLVLFLLFSAETYQYFEHLPSLGEKAAHWALASLSVLWALFGAVLLSLGVVRKSAALRYTALALFGITLGKVFFMDTAHLEALYRILGFLTLGAMLIAGSFAYTRFFRSQER